MSRPSPEPTAAELRRAHAAGFRPRSRGLELASRFVLLAALLWMLGSNSSFVVDAWSASLERALRGSLQASMLLEGVWTLWALALVVALLASVLVALVTRQVGLVRPLGGAGRRGGRRLAPVLARWLLFGCALATGVYLARGLIAGAARGSVATSPALSLLWWGWITRVVFVAGALMFVFGCAEWMLARVASQASWMRQQDARNS